MFVAERFILNLVKRYGEHPVSTDMEVYMVSTGLQVLETAPSHIHSRYEKSIIEKERYSSSKTERSISMIIFLVEK
jgi:hypothetical protein